MRRGGAWGEDRLMTTHQYYYILVLYFVFELLCKAQMVTPQLQICNPLILKRTLAV
jgi:hypothetical protein